MHHQHSRDSSIPAQKPASLLCRVPVFWLPRLHMRKLCPFSTVVGECASIRSDSNVSPAGPPKPSASSGEPRLTTELDGFAWDAINEEAARIGVTVEELVTFSVLYYLADVDSGRTARRISMSPYPRTSA